MKFFAVLMAIASAMLFANAPSSAAAPAAGLTKPAASAVRLPFAPTIGQVIRARSTQETRNVRDGKEALRNRTTGDDELLFTERNAEGYILHWTTVSAKSEAPGPAAGFMQALVDSSVGKTMRIQTDTNGVPLRILNLPEMRTLMQTSLDAAKAEMAKMMAAAPPEARAPVLKMFDGMIGMYRDLEDAALNQMMLETPSMLFGYGGAQLTQGRPFPFEAKVALPLIGTEVDFIGRLELREQRPDGGFTIVASSATSPNGVKSAVTAFVEKMLASQPEAQRTALRGNLAKLEGLSVTDELTITLDAAGLPVTAEYRKRSALPDEGQVEIRRLDAAPDPFRYRPAIPPMPRVG